MELLDMDAHFQRLEGRLIDNVKFILWYVVVYSSKLCSYLTLSIKIWQNKQTRFGKIAIIYIYIDIDIDIDINIDIDIDR